MKKQLIVGLMGALALTLASGVVQAQKPAGVIDSIETEWPGIQTELLEVKRMADNTIRVRWRWRNTTNQDVKFDPYAALRQGHTYILDPVNKKKHLVVTDASGNPIGSDVRGRQTLKQGELVAYWAKFPAPPPSVEKITVVIMRTPPFEDIPVAK